MLNACQRNTQNEKPIWKCIEVVMAMRTARHYAHLATYKTTNTFGSVSKWS